MNNYIVADYFTNEQKQAILDDGTNILVSAAAGCGKTTLMVERIIRKIINDHVNITELIVVTFSEAAATELKQRLEIALSKRLENESDNDFLKHQLTLLSDSYIMTFHALCFRLLKENNVAFDFDRTLTIGDSIQLKELKLQAYEQLKKGYQKHEDYLVLDDFYNSLINDNPLFEIIDKTLELCNTKASLEKFQQQNYNNTQINSIFDYPDFNEVQTNISLLYVNNILDCFNKLASFDNSDKVEKTIHEGFDYFSEIKSEIINCNYQKIKNKLDEYSIFRKVKDSSTQFENLRLMIKDEMLVNLKKLYIANNDEMLEFINQNKINTEVLLKYTQIYAKILKSLKVKTGILDFNDLEQYTIELLYSNDNFSKIALKLQNSFNEIMIDEYQDTNMIQEKIVNALANSYNTFMVGDIKQSIYRFRNATSKLFSDKYELYNNSNKGKVIDLSFNFRSKNEVLETTNFIFKSNFSKNIGGIDYDEKNQLYFKNEQLNLIKGDFKTQLLVNTNTKGSKDKNNYTSTARMIASKIKELVNTGINYHQITILVKNRTNIDIIKYIFESENIPIMIHTNKGFYSSFEIQDLKNLLKMLFNPYDDVAFIGALTSHFFNLDDNDLLQLSLIKENNYFNKLKSSNYTQTFELVCDLIKISKQLNPAQLINYIYRVTDYKSYIINQSNYEQFLINTISFKNILNNSMEYFNSLKYVIDQLEENIAQNFDNSIPAVISNKEDVVNLMSIHKSKGLEFDYVFLFDESSINLTQKDNSLKVLNNNLVLKYFNPEQRITASLDNSAKTTFSPLSILIDFSNKKEIIAEEMRILYVALTRAKLQLFIVMNINEDTLENHCLKVSVENDWLLDEAIVFNYKKMLEPLLCSFLRHKDALLLREGISMNANDEIYNFNTHLFDVEVHSIENNATDKVRISSKKYPTKIVEPHQVNEQTIKISSPTKHQEKLLDFNNIVDFNTFKHGLSIHRILETLDFNSNSIAEDLSNLSQKYQISKQSFVGIESFINNDFFKTITTNYYKKEYNFHILHDNTITNGIIDLYVETNEIIYIIDYKSDKLEIDTLKMTYSNQLLTYKNAIKNTTNKKITCLLYSIYHESFIEI